MQTRLEELGGPSLSTFLEATRAHYVRARAEAGHDPHAAGAAVDATLEAAFPDGVPAGRHMAYAIVDGDERVGWLWLGPHPLRPDDSSWWVNDISIDPAHRRRGHARAAMRLAAGVARARGGATLGLNVFGDNAAAIALYASLGYSVDSMQMSVRL